VSFDGLNQQLNSLPPFRSHSQVVPPLTQVLLDIAETGAGVNAAGRAAKQAFEDTMKRLAHQRRLDELAEQTTEAHGFAPRTNRNE